MQTYKKLAVSISIFAFMVMPLFIQAQVGGGGGSPPVTITIDNPLSDKSANSIPAVLKIVFNDLVLPIGAMVAVIYIMYAGFMMVTARGNTKQIDEAKSAFFNAAIGTAILLGAWAISQAIATTINNIVAP